MTCGCIFRQQRQQDRGYGWVYGYGMSDPNQNNGQTPFGEQQKPPASSDSNPAAGSQPDETQYGQSSYDQHGQARYGSQQYGQQPYGQPAYGQPQYGQYAQSGQTPPNWQGDQPGQAQYGPQQYGPQGGQYPPPGAGYGQPGYGGQPYAYAPKQKIVAGILGILLGAFGVHNFYLGFIGKAIAQLLLTVLSIGILSWVSAIWGLVEGILILVSEPGSTWHRDAKGVELRD